MTAVQEGRLEIVRYARAISENPARAYGLWPRKGGLRVGADADIAVVQTGRSRALGTNDLHSRLRVTPFVGATVTAAVTHTVLRGSLVVDNGRVVGKPSGQDVRLSERTARK